MGTLSTASMRDYLRRSISSLNQNKLNGLLAEVDLRQHLLALGYIDRVSPGGWILRRVGAGTFGHNTVVIFPETVQAGHNYPLRRQMPQPPQGLHTICATFHQSGIHAFYCAAEVATDDNSDALTWKSIQLGVPAAQPWLDFPASMKGYFGARTRRHSFLHYNANAAAIPASALEEEFSKEHLRVSFQTAFLSECSDVDGIFWGERITYPLEIKEKTPASDNKLGQYFGLDVGPFVKLAFYAAKRGNLHSIFIVKEIDDPATRNLVSWWFITFDRLAQYASWVQQSGGASMTGGRSSVVKVPKAEFLPLDAGNLASL
jgi:hypothetical protein